MWRKRNHSDARSMEAASYRYFGTAVRPASAMSMMNGVHCQVSTMISESSAVALPREPLHLPQAERAEHRVDDAELRVEHELPEQADDDRRQHHRHQEQRRQHPSSARPPRDQVGDARSPARSAAPTAPMT